MTAESQQVLDAPETDAAEARNWLGTLAGLLSRCEYHRSEITGRRLGPDAAFLLSRAELMVFASEDLARATTFPERLDGQQAEAIARAGAFVSATRAIDTGPSRGMLWSVMSTLTGSGQTVDSAAVRDGLLAAADALESYFNLFGRRLSTPSPSGWLDAAGAFIADFRRMIKELPV